MVESPSGLCSIHQSNFSKEYTRSSESRARSRRERVGGGHYTSNELKLFQHRIANQNVNNQLYGSQPQRYPGVHRLHAFISPLLLFHLLKINFPPSHELLNTQLGGSISYLHHHHSVLCITVLRHTDCFIANIENYHHGLTLSRTLLTQHSSSCIATMYYASYSSHCV